MHRNLCPQGKFVKADYTQLAFAPSSVDAVVALYTFGHVPKGELPGLLSRIATWLRPEGHLLATMAPQYHPDGVYNWLGVPMFFSGLDVDANLGLIAEAGLELVEHEVVCQDEGEEGNPCFLWILARRPE